MRLRWPTRAGLPRDLTPSTPMSTLVLHINREMIHHGAEIACIRDFYVHSQ